MIFVFRLSNSGLSLAMYPSSVVQTGVKSLGCEQRTAHVSPIHSWKRMRPSVVSATKSGATSPMRRYRPPPFVAASTETDMDTPHLCVIVNLGMTLCLNPAHQIYT